jgi:hypothetical protein
MELFNKALFLSQQKIFALTHRRVYTLMVNLFQILNQFVLLFPKNIIEKSSMIWRVLPLVKINPGISETPCIIDRKSIWNKRHENVNIIFLLNRLKIACISIETVFVTGLHFKFKELKCPQAARSCQI